jgi:hypothetical protein
MGPSSSQIHLRAGQEPHTTQVVPSSSPADGPTGFGQLTLPKGAVIKILPATIAVKPIAPPQLPRETVPLTMPFSETIRVREESELPLDVLRLGEIDWQEPSNKQKPREEKKKEKKKGKLSLFFASILHMLLEQAATPKDRKITKANQLSKLRSFFKE